VSLERLDLDRLEKLYAKATPGPYEIIHGVNVAVAGWGRAVANFGGYQSNVNPVKVLRENTDNAKFFVAVHAAIPDLITRIRELEAENAKLRAADKEGF